MRLKPSSPFLALVFAALSLAACVSRNEIPAYEHLATEDDDAFCRQGGKVAVGSPDYVYCRKDRDAARNAAISRADRKQHDLADYMMAHPDHPSQ
jgi:DICT domain-containing protein